MKPPPRLHRRLVKVLTRYSKVVHLKRYGFNRTMCGHGPTRDTPNPTYNRAGTVALARVTCGRCRRHWAEITERHELVDA